MYQAIREQFRKLAAATILWALCASSPALAQGIIRTLAGTGTPAFFGDGGPAASAALNLPKGLAIDGSGNIYVADSGNARVRRITPAGMIGTVAGNGYSAAAGDGGYAVGASISDVMAVVVDPAGNLYIADSSNRRIRKVNTAGIITTIAGVGVQGFSGDGGPAVSAMLGRPVALALDSGGNLFFADSVNQRIRKIDTNGIITTVAGNGIDAFSGDGGQATGASLGFPIGVTVDLSGNIYIADGDNARIRKVTPGGIISTVAGNGRGGFSGDGGPALSASINIPSDVAVDGAGNLYIADAGNNRVRKVDTTGTISTIAGTGTDGYSGDGGISTQAALNYPWSLTADPSGNIYISDRVNNRVRLIAGVQSPAPSLVDNSAVNGATFTKGQPIAPGAIVTIFGSNFAAGTAFAQTVPLPTSLGGTSVTFNGVAAPLFYVSPGQINAQAPFDMATGQVQIQVHRGGVNSSTTVSSSASFSPGIFVMNQQTNAGAIVHSSDFSLVTASNPARPGEYISIFATGLGPVRIPVPSGSTAPSVAPFADTVNFPTVLIGGATAGISFSGLAPGFVGLYQINAQVPAGAQAGNLQLQIMVGTSSSNTVTLQVTR
jgi:uncharacterized protein (TIGR03437 family)